MKNFRVTSTANGITISQPGVGSVSVKMVNGAIVRTNTGLEGKNHQYALNISKFVEGVAALPKYRKLGFAATVKAIAEVAKTLTECTSFRNLSNQLRRQAEVNKLVPAGAFFYEG